MKIASWNVNSLNVRMPHLAQWLRDAQPDIVALQETKVDDERFPDSALAELGYRSVFCGQKTYNGVALLSKVSFAPECITAIPGFDDPQKRARMGAFGRRRVQEALEWRYEVPKLLAAYATLFADRPYRVSAT